MKSPSAETARERLGALSHLDAQITDILAKGSKVINLLVRGKKQESVASKENAKQDFTDALKEYNELIITVNKELHEEVRRLHAAFKTTVLPLHVPVQANSFGNDKENELWQVIYKSLSEEEKDALAKDS